MIPTNAAGVFLAPIVIKIKPRPTWNAPAKKPKNISWAEIRIFEEKKYPIVNSFLKNINEISEKVVEKDITLFEADPIILQNVSFKLLWNSNISDETKNTIWKYLQAFCIINIKTESSDEKINKVIKSIESNEKVKDKETVKNMKKLKKLNENFDIKGIKKVIDENPSSVDNGMGEIDNMFQNTNIGKIAKEVTEDLNIEGIMSGGGGIEDLFSGGNMANIMQTISSIFDSMASIIADTQNFAGTYIMVALAWVDLTASSTLLKTGRPKCSWPPFFGVTPPTSFVPYFKACSEWNVPWWPVKPWQITFVFLLTKIDI